MMAINVELAKRAEVVARKICQERGMPVSLWEMVLMEAYDRITRSDREAAARKERG